MYAIRSYYGTVLCFSYNEWVSWVGDVNDGKGGSGDVCNVRVGARDGDRACTVKQCTVLCFSYNEWVGWVGDVYDGEGA